jgi:LysM repeat protein
MALPIGKAVKLSDAAVLPTDAELAKIQQTIPPTAGNGTHTVVQGETLYMIAKRYNVDKKYLEVWNKVDDDTPLKAGQMLVIQGDMKIEVPQYSKFYTETQHIAQDGETLTEIAKFHEISLPNLLEWNNLAANTSLKEGQRLWIKPRPTFHKAGQGETIDMIANMYEISPQDIYSWNNFEANYVLKKGETIIVSLGAVLPPKQETPPALPKEEHRYTPISVLFLSASGRKLQMVGSLQLKAIAFSGGWSGPWWGRW